MRREKTIHFMGIRAVVPGPIFGDLGSQVSAELEDADAWGR